MKKKFYQPLFGNQIFFQSPLGACIKQLISDPAGERWWSLKAPPCVPTISGDNSSSGAELPPHKMLHNIKLVKYLGARSRGKLSKIENASSCVQNDSGACSRNKTVTGHFATNSFRYKSIRYTWSRFATHLKSVCYTFKVGSLQDEVDSIHNINLSYKEICVKERLWKQKNIASWHRIRLITTSKKNHKLARLTWVYSYSINNWVKKNHKLAQLCVYSHDNNLKLINIVSEQPSLLIVWLG